MSENAPSSAETPSWPPITPENPLYTGDLRDHPIFKQADPEGVLPAVTIVPTETLSGDRPSRNKQPYAIVHEGQQVGEFNIVKPPSSESTRSWINGIKIEQNHQGQKLSLPVYLGSMVVLNALGKDLESDPQGLSVDSAGVWSSLERRGVATRSSEHDVHGNSKFTTASPSDNLV